MSNVVFDLFKVFSSNFLVLVVGIINGFLIPKFLGIEQYAIYKTFGLYVGYVGILHFGFIDGIYIKYGGIRPNEIPKSDLKSEWLFLLSFQSLITVIWVILAYLVDQPLLISVSLSILPINLITFYKFLYQATGDFSSYAKINSLRPVLLLTSTLILIFLVREKSAAFFIAASVIVPYMIFSVLLFRQVKQFKNVGNSPVLSKNNFSNISVGIFIMIGNLSSMFFYSMDRWFVKFLLTTEDFSYYSFAVSMMGMVMILISSVAMTFYPMLVREKDNQELINKLKTYLMILGALSSVTYFFFDIVVRSYLPNYSPSLGVIAILFAGFPAIAVINAIYVNLYKAQKVEKKYFFTVIGMAAVSFSLNLVAVLVNKSNITIALATTVAFYFWFFYSSKDFRGAQTSFKEIIYLVLFLAVFFITTRMTYLWFGLPLYIIGVLAITCIFYKSELTELISKILKPLKKR
ncbi:hypothetical protein [Kosmotoga pacifica]|uniref:Polysaccharide biosynthesis protein n=1 Tax=Kosmotoga pacifica TaxID=1330330 RepID=A0A0G2Z987_9BACT|nr:hypothetical protein [Kosmotoga pacifica]AKI96636.1 hypothetical protein IX53_01030 [Kosmotoga pacifica]